MEHCGRLKLSEDEEMKAMTYEDSCRNQVELLGATQHDIATQKREFNKQIVEET